MRRHLASFMLVVLVILTSEINCSAHDASIPPLPRVVRPACPFEGCTYGEWTLRKRTFVYEEPNEKARIINVLKPGSRIRSLTGEVHLLRYGRILALKDVTLKCLQENPPGKLRVARGEMVNLMEYMGEGLYTIWHKGRMCQTWQGWETPDAYLPAGQIWGKLLRPSTQQWWVRIQIPKAARTGWILNPNAKGMDRLE